MTKIKAFKGVRYNLEKIADLSQVVCPPYDVINKQEQGYYYHQNPYNFIRLILNKEESWDSNLNNKYTRADVFFSDWLKTGILKQDLGDSLYFYKQDFFCEGKEFSRLGFIGLLQLSKSGIVFPHEDTHAAPKTDRLELVKRVKANLSPIFTVFSDKDKIIESIFNGYFSNKKPDLLLKDAQGVRNSLWCLTDAKKIEEIQEKLIDKQIFIADGHHRYEVASTYRRLMEEQDKNYSPDKSYNYVMTYLTTLESDGLCIMPVHRIIKTEIDINILKSIFKIDRMSSIADLENKLSSSSKKRCVLGLYYRKGVLFLELKGNKELGDYFRDRKCFMNLEVAILDFYVLNELLKTKKDAIMYTKEVEEAREFVDCNDGFAAFILRPTSMKQIKDVALCGEKMPPKSTYFYPKLLSGLTVHKFE
ncbi:DUF1015 domain-containing protein [Candidatus Omnitrophota bacterium]